MLKQLKVNILGQSTLNQYTATSGMVSLRLFSDVQLELGEQDLVLRQYPKYWSVVSKRLDENTPPPERESIEQLVTRRISQAMCELKRIWIPFTHLKLLAWEILERQEEMSELLKTNQVVVTRNECYALSWAAHYELDYLGEAAVDDLVKNKRWLTSIPVTIGRVVTSVPSHSCIFLGSQASHAVYENKVYSFKVDVGVVTLSDGKQFNIPTFRKKTSILRSNADVLLLRDIDLAETHSVAFNGQVDPALVKFAMTKVKKVVLMNHKSSS